MQETLLHYIWKLQLFDKKNLRTHAGKKVEVLWPGSANVDTGPDFLSARVKIDNKMLYGHIEIHIKESDWHTHQHDKNEAYDNVIMHVVWHKAPLVKKKKNIPTLYLSQYVNPNMLVRYEELMTSEENIPCVRYLPAVAQKKWGYMLKKALKERLEQKYLFVCELLKQNKNDSDMVSYQVLAQAFGFGINKKAFFRLSQKVPFRVVQEKNNDLSTLEALFFGQSGFLTGLATKNAYIDMLRKKHASLTKKYRLPSPMPKTSWKFFRSRPANAPTLRIAQMVRFLYKQEGLFSFLVNTTYQNLKQRLGRSPSPYWKKHYAFDKRAKKPIPAMGIQSINTIIINTVIPLLAAYGKIRGDDFYVEQAIKILEQLPPENNTITRHWTQVGMPIKTAFDSQGSLALFNDFCSVRRCLSCSIGRYILKKS